MNGELGSADRRELADLGHHWADAYALSFNGDTWAASPLSDPAVILTAESPEELRLLIRGDYDEHNRRGTHEPWQGCSL